MLWRHNIQWEEMFGLFLLPTFFRIMQFRLNANLL